MEMKIYAIDMSQFSIWEDVITRELLFEMFANRGVKSVMAKQLGPNNNSKNQIYLAKDLAELDLPAEPVTSSVGLSQKKKAGKPIFHSRVPWVWLSPESESPAPYAQLIYYPQYPEVRLSGLLRSSPASPRHLLAMPTESTETRGQEPGRIMLFGTGSDDRVYGTMVTRNSPAAHQIRSELSGDVLTRFQIAPPVTTDSRSEILSEISRIHNLGWLDAVQLSKDGSFQTCRGPRCGGHTLEAHLGVSLNGRAEPDFGVWEVKSHGVPSLEKSGSGRITLFTPEPDRGEYATHGTDWFVRKFGNQKPGGKRWDFTGIHKVSGEPNTKTGLELKVVGYDSANSLMTDGDGYVGLFTTDGELASGWSFEKLLSHWRRKHAMAAYVPVLRQVGPPLKYRYGSDVHLGEGTHFGLFLKSIVAGTIVYDPGIKTELQGVNRWKSKARSQFRVGVKDLGQLYNKFERVDSSTV